VGAPALSCNFPERPGETLAARHPFSRDECEAAARRHLPLYENFEKRKNNPCDGVAIWALARYHVVLNRAERPRTIDNTPCPSRTLQVRYKGRSVAEAGPGQEAPRFFDEADQWRLWHLIDLLEARAPQPITTDLSGREDDA
ncbi:MAG TPA: hypothetical protein PKI11_21500, partial [Candidatus Hydrogenedentes bacterium]|nr:hypothetical protein [Candidatus Hydrogenedentota bacterium]